MECSLFVCETLSSESFSVIKIMYRSGSGRLGFESDDLAADVLRFLLKGSATWDFKKNIVRVFDESVYFDPFIFLSGVRPADRFTRLLTFNNPGGVDEILIKTISNIAIEDDCVFLESARDAIEKGYLLTQTNFNDFSIDVFSDQKVFFIEKLKEKASSLGLMVNVVDKEKMPAW